MNNQEMIHWWEGYVIIRIRGKKLERLINRMMNRRFSAWNITRTTEEDAQVSITIRDFFQLRSLLKETGCRVKVVKKVGLPFIIRKAKKRMGLFIGAITFCFMLYIFSMMIWSVEIEGIRLPENEQFVREELAKMEVKPWNFKFEVEDPTLIKLRVKEVLPEVTWVGFQFRGTTAQLKVVEKTLPDKKEATNPRHLVAKKKAIIYDLFVEQGQPVVKPNQHVQKGDILVSGILGTEDNQEIVSAKGKVLGEVWYEGSISIPLTQKRSVLTGETKKRHFLHLGPLAIQMWGYGNAPFDQFTVEEWDYHLGWGDWKTPISWTRERILETKSVKQTLTKEEALQQAINMSRKNVNRNLSPEAEIKEEKILLKRIENGKVYIKMHYTVIEEIASEQLIIQGD